MLYLDTCVLIPLLVQEGASDRVRRFFIDNANQPLTISTWTQTELVSALSLKARSKQITHESAHLAIQTFQEIAEESFSILLPSAKDYVLASQFLMHFDTGLRAGDALHLAIAHEHQLTLLTLDKLMLSAAQVLGIAAQTP